MITFSVLNPCKLGNKVNEIKLLYLCSVWRNSNPPVDLNLILKATKPFRYLLKITSCYSCLFILTILDKLITKICKHQIS